MSRRDGLVNIANLVKAATGIAPGQPAGINAVHNRDTSHLMSMSLALLRQLQGDRLGTRDKLGEWEG